MREDRPGSYVTTREAGVTQTTALEKNVVDILPVGTTVQIVEVVHCQEEKRWRGRLEEPVKGWISLMASDSGFRWVDQPSSGGHCAGNMEPVLSGALPPQLATTGFPDVDAPQDGMQLHALQPMDSIRGRSPAEAGGSSHTVGPVEQSLSAQFAAGTAYGNYIGTVCNFYRPCSVVPSQQGSIHYSGQAQAPISQGSSLQCSVSGETCSTKALPCGSFRLSVDGEDHVSRVQHAQGLSRPASLAVGKQQALSAVPSARRALSSDKVTLLEGNKLPEVLAVLQGIKQKVKDMEERYSVNTDNVQASGSNMNISRAAVHEQAVPSTEAVAPAKGPLCKEELDEKWMGA
jgi:hypothetical protein